MKPLVDMNLSPQWVDLFIAAGFEAVHWSTIGQANAPDSEIMSYAAANGFIVLTHDLDFSAILAATQGERPSVIQIRAADLASKPSESRSTQPSDKWLTSWLRVPCLRSIQAAPACVYCLFDRIGERIRPMHFADGRGAALRS